MEPKQSKNIQTMFTTSTEFCADSIEWCPHDPNKNAFVCANYQLQKEESCSGFQKRVGKILLFSINSEGLKLRQTINTNAVLDQKWCHTPLNNCSILGVANASGEIQIYKLIPETLQLELLQSYKVQHEEQILILSLDWSTGICSSTEPNIICSDSKGSIHLLKLSNEKLTLESTWSSHEFEAWITGFYYFDTNVFFSGGDDSLFLKFDKRVGQEPVSKNRSHQAGVTSFHCHYSKEYLVATGSYDEHVRLWDVRKLKNAAYSIKMPGTLWRLKWNSLQHNYLLAACMLGGVHILDTSSDCVDIVGNYYEHKDISYGADWSYLNKNNGDYVEDGQFIIGTCSFYDHLLCISKFCYEKENE